MNDQKYDDIQKSLNKIERDLRDKAGFGTTFMVYLLAVFLALYLLDTRNRLNDYKSKSCEYFVQENYSTGKLPAKCLKELK